METLVKILIFVFILIFMSIGVVYLTLILNLIWFMFSPTL